MSNLITLFSTDDGVERLLQQPGDVKARPAAAQMSINSVGFKQMFNDYLGDLKTAYGIVVPWWAETIAAQETLGLNREDAIDESFDKRVAGAASHPNVVWIIRTYWLECAKLNETSGEMGHVYPEVFLLQWLIDAGEDELVRLVACMPYWPIGLDENGDWC